MPSRYGHESRILLRSYAPINAIIPGMIIEFIYDKKKTSDSKPLVFVLWNDDLYKSGSKSYLIHGININYLNNTQLKNIFNEISKGSGRGRNVIVTENQTKYSYDDNLPSRNLIKKEFTRVDLPYSGNIRGGRRLSMSESQNQLNLLYEKKIKPFVKNLDIYRTYKIDKMKTIKAVKYNMRF